MLASLGPSGLVDRVRASFLAFTAFVSVAGLGLLPRLDTLDQQAVLGAASVLLVLWAWRRYRSPARWTWSDPLVPVVIVAAGWAAPNPSWAFVVAVAAVTQWSLDTSPRTTALVVVGAFVTNRMAAVAAGHVLLADPTNRILEAATFVVAGVVLTTLARLARRHERRASEDRMLVAVSSDLLAAQDVVEVATAAVEGLYRIGGQEDAGASMWLSDGSELELVAAAGPLTPELVRISLDHVPDETRENYLAGRPFQTDATTTREIEVALGLSPQSEAVLVLPLHDGDGHPSGALTLTSVRPIDLDGSKVVHHFANEVCLALARARLVDTLQRTNRQLREAGDRRHEFASTVSHELRTPLTAICGFAEVLESRWEHLADHARLDLLRRIRRQAERQRRLVDDLLLVSRMMSGQLRAAPTTVDLATAVHEAVTNLEIGSRAVVQVPNRLEVVVDADHLQQMLGNLLDNAVKYGAPPYEIVATVASGRTALVVRDHGPGVPAGFEETMFEPFRQADGSDRRDVGGMGIGLSIVRELVEVNRGTVRYVPKPGGQTGSAFVISLPARTAGRPGMSAVDGTRATAVRSGSPLALIEPAPTKPAEQ